MSFTAIATGGGFTILGAFIGGWIGYRSAINLHNISEFKKAASDFRNAFLCEIIYLKYHARLPECERTYTNLKEFLKAGYIFRHLKAFDVFQAHLSKKERIGIGKAWEEYCNFEQYADKNNEEKLKKLALKNIEELLKFAPIK